MIPCVAWSAFVCVDACVCVCDVVCLCVGKQNVRCFVLSMIYGVRCRVVCVYLCVVVCECFWLFDVFVCFVREILCDVVGFVFLCALSVFVCLLCYVCMCVLLVMCDVMSCGLCVGVAVIVPVACLLFTVCVCVWIVIGCVLLCGLIVFVICVVFVRACIIVCCVCNRLCDVAWCFMWCLCCACVLRSYHVKDAFVCVGDSLCDVVGHVLCACV